MIIIMRFGENVLRPKYINIFEIRGVLGVRTYSTKLFFIIKKKRKKDESMTYTKIKFYFILN